MQTVAKFGVEQLMHEARTRHPRQSLKGVTHHHQLEMCLRGARLRSTRTIEVPGVTVTVVHKLNQCGRKLFLEHTQNTPRPRPRCRIRHVATFSFVATHTRNPSCVRLEVAHITGDMRRRNTRPRAFDPDPDAPKQCCDAPGCTQEAGYRAPRSRTTLNQYFWFCLEHVREYNARWDFYKGMSAAQIEAHLRADVAWDRPSWKIGHMGRQPFSEEDVLDPLDILNASRAARANRHKESREPKTPPPLRDPLETMGLRWPVSLDEVKARYKALAREHHPDANNGDLDAEERFKIINVAYAALRAHFTANTTEDFERSA